MTSLFSYILFVKLFLLLSSCPCPIPNCFAFAKRGTFARALREDASRAGTVGRENPSWPSWMAFKGLNDTLFGTERGDRVEENIQKTSYCDQFHCDIANPTLFRFIASFFLELVGFAC